MLAFRTVSVRREGAAYVTVTDPTTALVRVENESDRPAELRVDGRYMGSFTPDETRIVSVPVGAHELAMVSGGWTFDRARMSLSACGEAVFEAEMPRSNDLIVQNPLPIPVEVHVDRGCAATGTGTGLRRFARSSSTHSCARSRRSYRQRADGVRG